MENQKEKSKKSEVNLNSISHDILVEKGYIEHRMRMEEKQLEFKMKQEARYNRIANILSVIFVIGLIVLLIINSRFS